MQVQPTDESQHQVPVADLVSLPVYSILEWIQVAVEIGGLARCRLALITLLFPPAGFQLEIHIRLLFMVPPDDNGVPQGVNFSSPVVHDSC